MPKYDRTQYRQVKPRRWKVHPIWRGVGLILIILIPIMAFAAAIMIVRTNIHAHWFDVPAELAGSYSVPDSIKLLIPDLDRLYYVDIAFAACFMIVGFGILSVLYAFMYRMFGPDRYGPVDSPPIRHSPHRSVRF
jgi:hypothetical protein